MPPQIPFDVWLKQSFDFYKTNLGLLIAVSLIAGILSSVTLGILAGPMLGGLALITLRLRRGTAPKPDVVDLLDGFKHFGQMFAFAIVWGIIYLVADRLLGFLPLIGRAFSSVGLALLWTGLLFAPFLIVDRGLAFWPASLASFNAARPVFWPLFGYVLVSAVFSACGALACGIGILVTAPFGICAATVAYEEFLRAAPIEATATETPPTAEPAPETPPAA